jgi:hypothetical protein
MPTPGKAKRSVFRVASVDAVMSSRLLFGERLAGMAIGEGFDQHKGDTADLRGAAVAPHVHGTALDDDRARAEQFRVRAIDREFDFAGNDDAIVDTGAAVAGCPSASSRRSSSPESPARSIFSDRFAPVR